MYVHVFPSVEARDWILVSSSITLYLTFGDRISLDLEVISLARLDRKLAPGIYVSTTPIAGVTGMCHHAWLGSGYLNSDLYAHDAVILPSEAPPQAYAALLFTLHFSRYVKCNVDDIDGNSYGSESNLSPF